MIVNIQLVFGSDRQHTVDTDTKDQFAKAAKDLLAEAKAAINRKQHSIAAELIHAAADCYRTANH